MKRFGIWFCCSLLLTSCAAEAPLIPGSLTTTAAASGELTLKLRLDYPARLMDYVSDAPLRMDVVMSYIPMRQVSQDLDYNQPDSDKNYRASLLDSQEVPLGKDFEYTFKAQASDNIVYLEANLHFYFDGNHNGIYDAGEITCLAPTPQLSWNTQEQHWELYTPSSFTIRPYTPPNPFNQLSYTLKSPENPQYAALAGQTYTGMDVELGVTPPTAPAP